MFVVTKNMVKVMSRMRAEPHRQDVRYWSASLTSCSTCSKEGVLAAATPNPQTIIRTSSSAVTGIVLSSVTVVIEVLYLY